MIKQLCYAALRGIGATPPPLHNLVNLILLIAIKQPPLWQNRLRKSGTNLAVTEMNPIYGFSIQNSEEGIDVF